MARGLSAWREMGLVISSAPVVEFKLKQIRKKGKRFDAVMCRRKNNTQYRSSSSSQRAWAGAERSNHGDSVSKME